MTGTVIRIRPEHLLRALVLLLAVVAIPLGIAHTPYLHGRATLLTPERRDIMRYLDRAAGWADGLGREADSLQRILEVQPTQLHQRVSVILGSKNEVERVTRYHLDK